MNFRKFSLLITLSVLYFIPVFNQADFSTGKEIWKIGNVEDVCMATPAIGDGMIIFRTQHSMIAIGKK